MEVRIKTNRIEGRWNLLNYKNLKKVGVKFEDIEKIETFFDVPGRLYTEPGVASETHPCSGSIGVWLYTKDNKIASIQDIFYYDKNPKKGHHKGLPHWNHERRYIDTKGTVKVSRRIEWHIIPDSPELEIYFNGKTKTVQRA